MAPRRCGASWANACTNPTDSEINANKNEIERIRRLNKNNGLPEDYAELPVQQLQGPSIGPIIYEELGVNTIAPATIPADAEETSNEHPAADHTHTPNHQLDTRAQDPRPSIITAAPNTIDSINGATSSIQQAVDEAGTSMEVPKVNSSTASQERSS
eukprot:3580376-Pyramimonas_sp.AAC.1